MDNARSSENHHISCALSSAVAHSLVRIEPGAPGVHKYWYIQPGVAVRESIGSKRQMVAFVFQIASPRSNSTPLAPRSHSTALQTQYESALT